ncbi:LEAF RUST 10 DISEASE-RESISTANCE LOCUS RECEPTOR-LIKE PROTEIN KINASE-like 1.1 isoform X2 [Trifolium pratense]|uniref:LEAF RUST 10 DISEASE-RESISTANCE LOCUS RECEPTOR-LIKE PROTEIN KINASE-like 1.1 isoform X2 n=1 Tax=Trifolium pratense TaxID=57577 RepID=UPI001E69375C|nr:LEAF RUST 10 DISEASE-RESISTANCE LOCUS RECEPTOR-LIKE PROTEIN KINASE-like 1.1 isoform X2 [Trifolium pratense]
MASYFMFSFILLFCYFLLLPFAEAELKYPTECEEFSSPADQYVEEIYFPYTTVDNKKCRFYITAKKIHEHHKIDSIKYINNSIFIYILDYSDFDSDSIKNTPVFSHKNMSRYSINCPDYGIYFISNPDYPPPMPTNFQFPCPQHHPLYYGCSKLFSFLEIKVDKESCEGCCLLDQETLNLNCFPAPTPPYFEYPSDTQTTRKEPGLKAAVIGLSIGLATTLFVILFLCYWRIKSSEVKNKSGTNHRGLSRNTTIPESGAVYFGIPVFSYDELKEATNNFDQARQIGEGGFGTIYYGKLGDGREVAVKRLFERNYRPVESFTNEIQILTRMRHRNLVSLYGCTSRHSRELLLVYEYVPNDTVSSHLHGEKAKNNPPLPWAVRIKIAIETAGALTYLHASDVIHRDVKTNNILLDNSFCVKVADFGLSRLYPNDVTHVSTAPRGTPGYVDPEYRLCYQLTDKSDVYSFGVVLVELISSLPAVDLTRDRDDIKLANLAVRKIRRSEFHELVDPSLGIQTNERLKNVIISVAELAFQCLQDEKELRPSMSEVLEVLQRIESEKNEGENHEGIDFHHGVEVVQSYAHPSLPNTWIKPQRHQQTL